MRRGDLIPWLGVLELEAPVVNRVNVENKIQSLKILDCLLKDYEMFRTTCHYLLSDISPRSYFHLCSTWNLPQETSTNAACVAYAVLKTVKIKLTNTILPTEIWSGKIFSAREGVLALEHL